MLFLTLKRSLKSREFGPWSLIVLGFLGVVSTILFWPRTPPSLLSPLLSREMKTTSELLPSEFLRQVQIVQSLIQQSYVEPITPLKTQKMTEVALASMVEALDAHSAYLTPEMMQELQESIQGQFCGVGLEMSTTANGSLYIISPIEETAAFIAGLQAGDEVLHIDGKSIRDTPHYEAVKKMRGRPGTFVTLTVKRGQDTVFDVKLKRSPINFKSVRWHREPGNIGYLRIAYFDEHAKRLVQEALTSLQNPSKEPLRGLLIDVRNNPGGLLEQAIGITDLLLEDGAIVLTRTQENPEGTVIYANPKAKQIIHQIPLVILVNAGSASGAELFAGALQDHNRAVIVGERTFGKASLQALYPLEGGAGLKLTIAHYDTPAGRSIQAEGILPDISIPPHYKIISEGEPSPVREENLKFYLPPHGPLRKKGLAESAALPVGKITDFQRSYALDLVRGMAIYQQNHKNCMGQPSLASASKPLIQ